MLALIHAAHAHFSVAQKRWRIHLRQLGGPIGIRTQRSSSIAGSVDTLSENRVSAVNARFHHYVICFRYADSKFIDRNRLNILPVRGYNGQFQTGNTHVENGHCRTINETQSDFLTALEQTEPSIFRCNTVHQKGIGITGHI